MQKFKILWFDDEKSNYELIKKQLEGFTIKELNKQLDVNIQETFVDEEKFVELIKDVDYSLVVTDLNLLNGARGNLLIEFIRQHNVFVDILLYSSNHKQLDEVTSGANFVEGIYRYALNDLGALAEKVQKVMFQVHLKEGFVIRRYELYNDTLRQRH
ncbi:MAG TPA: hypothetical protein VK154_15230 [Chitinophagales bacterium]|nr:hypothetical protein [Chitinophagales bacterium]